MVSLWIFLGSSCRLNENRYRSLRSIKLRNSDVYTPRAPLDLRLRGSEHLQLSRKTRLRDPFDKRDEEDEVGKMERIHGTSLANYN